MAPADEYVAEFVRHMNPLDVLTGAMIMRERAAWAAGDGGWWIDERRRYQLFLNPESHALDVHLDGASHRLCTVGEDAACAGDERGVAVMPASASLKSIIQLRQITGHPVLLADGARILGVCDEAEIIMALARGRHSGRA